MHKADVEILVGYIFWADFKILEACERVPAEDFTRKVTPDPGWHSLRGTLVHLLDTEYGWRATLQGLRDEGVLKEADYPDVGILKKRWQEEKAAWRAYIDSLDDEALNAVWRKRKGIQRRRWETIMHVVNDGTHHRSEAAAMLTGYGQSPGELNLLVYLMQRVEGKEG